MASSFSTININYSTNNQNQIMINFNPHIFNIITTKVIYHMSFTYPCPRKLREIMKMSLIQRQPKDKIQGIWSTYHAERNSNIAEVMTKDQYILLLQRVKRNPMFLLPIHRKGGHFKLLTQWQDNCFLGTYLQDYKRYGRNSHPYIVFTLFNELLFSKGIVLLRGDIVNYSLTKLQSQMLWSNLLRSYMDQQNYDLIDAFNHRQQNFDQKLYDQLYNIQ